VTGGKAGHWSEKMSLSSSSPIRTDNMTPASHEIMFTHDETGLAAFKPLPFSLTDVVNCRRWPLGKVSLPASFLIQLTMESLQSILHFSNQKHSNIQIIPPTHKLLNSHSLWQQLKLPHKKILNESRRPSVLFVTWRTVRPPYQLLATKVRYCQVSHCSSSVTSFS